MGIKLIPFLPQEMFDRVFEWWPWIGEKTLWLSDNLSKEIILYIMIVYLAGNIFMRIAYYSIGTWFERSGFAKEENKKRQKRYNFYMQEEVVEPLERIEKHLGIKKDEKK